MSNYLNPYYEVKGVCMKIKLGKRSFTFLIIPDANSKIVRFRLSALLLYSLTTSLIVIGLVLVTVTLSTNITGIKNLNAKNTLANELAVKTNTYEKTLTNK